MKSTEKEEEILLKSSSVLTLHQKRSGECLEKILISPSITQSVQQTLTKALREAGNFYYCQGFTEIGLSYYVTAAFGGQDQESWSYLGRFYEYGLPIRSSIFIPDDLLKTLMRYRLITFDQADRYKQFSGTGVKFNQNLNMAIKIYDYLMKRGYEPARNLLSSLCWQLGFEYYENHRYITAYNLFRLAFKAGNVHAAYMVGSMFENATLTASYKGVVSYIQGLKKSKHYYQKAALRGHLEAINALERVKGILKSYTSYQKYVIFDDFYEIDNNFFQNIDDHQPSNNSFLKRSPSNQKLTQWVGWSFEDRDEENYPA